jgi:SRSO17 transposase
MLVRCKPVFVKPLPARNRKETLAGRSGTARKRGESLRFPILATRFPIDRNDKAEYHHNVDKLTDTFNPFLSRGQDAMIATRIRKAAVDRTRTTPLDLPPFDAERAERLDGYTAKFRGVFQRSDQFLRFRAYLRGLLEPGERKNVEAIAAAASSAVPARSDLAQALQHFVSHSPWDGDLLQSAVRRAVLGDSRDGSWVVHDGAFPKKGRHSVGVQRQYARSLGRKLNCQVGVFVGQLGPHGYFPLAARLYLPAGWLRDHERLVPVEFRLPAGKPEVALQLLGKLSSEGVRLNGLLAETAYFAHEEFAEGLERWNIRERLDDEALAEALLGFQRAKALLGLDHFEGRTWPGWHHHVSLVFAAYGFLVSRH